MSDIVQASAPIEATPTSTTPETQSQHPSVKEVLEKPKEPVEVEEKEEDPRLASRFAALSRKEKQLIEREKALKDQFAEVERIKKREDLKKANKAKWLKEEGISFEELAKDMLNEDIEAPQTQEQKVQSEIEKAMLQFEERQKAKEEEARQRAKEERLKTEQQYYDEQVSAYKKSIRDVVQADIDKYELVDANNAYDEVFDVVEQYFNATRVIDKKTGKVVKEGEVLPVEKALDYVEDYLYEEYKKLLEKSKKLKPKVSEPLVEAIKESTPKQAIKESLTPSHVTLTNTKVAGTVSVDQPPRLNADESKKRAAALLTWTK